MRLVDRHPSLDGNHLLARFVPPRRFADVRFSTYRPSPEHPSQADALAAVEALVAGPTPRRRWTRGAAEATPPGLYLDGGYGVGKTHLIAAAWHAAPGPSAYLTFTELTALIGFVGMDATVAAFGEHRLVCLDEFELDDVANTLMTVTFLRRLLESGERRIATTSNSLPDRLGEGRFNADDFRREIAAIADHFAVVRIDGPDARAALVEVREALDDAEVAAAVERAGAATTVDRFDELLAHLRAVHPVQYAALLDDLDTVVLTGLTAVEDQGTALLLVALIDELYDQGLTVVASGCPVSALFPPSYREGGYRKKYGRAESRLSAMLGEAVQVPASRDTTGASGSMASSETPR